MSIATSVHLQIRPYERFFENRKWNSDEADVQLLLQAAEVLGERTYPADDGVVRVRLDWSPLIEWRRLDAELNAHIDPDADEPPGSTGREPRHRHVESYTLRRAVRAGELGAVGRLEMSTLTARFVLPLSSPCLAKWPHGSPPEVDLRLDDFDVNVRFVLSGEWRQKNQGDVDWTSGVDSLQIDVRSIAARSAPAVVVGPGGVYDSEVRQEYLRDQLFPYLDVAFKAANRTLRYFKYCLQTPLVTELSGREEGFSNPTWLTPEGEVLQTGVRVRVPPERLGSHGELRARPLVPSDISPLRTFVESPPDPTLVAELLADAKDAWAGNRLRRAVLELAIAAEVAVKRTFFAESSPAGAAFDYLEDKSKVSVRVIDLLDAIAKEAFARSYRTEHPDYFKDLDHLFRCRNKVAHRGELIFRDDGGKHVTPDQKLVARWWEAVAHVADWLRSVNT